MIAGPNGSGKSTLIALLEAAGIDFGEYLNADDIARGMHGDPAQVAAAAQAEVRRRREQALRQRRNHSFETVLSHPSHLDHLRSARAAGFRVIVYFVSTEDASINIGRVENRVLHGGHDVPRIRIVSRFIRSLHNLPAALAIAHEGAVFDNASAKNPMRQLVQLFEGELRTLESETELPVWWQELFPEVCSMVQGAYR
jgi:predicted ABC-type ATPase